MAAPSIASYETSLTRARRSTWQVHWAFRRSSICSCLERERINVVEWFGAKKSELVLYLNESDTHHFPKQAPANQDWLSTREVRVLILAAWPKTFCNTSVTEPALHQIFPLTR